MSRYASGEPGNICLARTAAGGMAVVGNADADAFAADVVVIERAESRLEIARLVGTVAAGHEPAVEARIIGSYRISADGQPLGDLLDQSLDREPEGHCWGALGLPHGLDTTVVPSARAGLTNDFAVARGSRGVSELERHPTLTIAPGERVTIGEHSGMVTAIDRRAGTIEVTTGDAERVTVSIDEIRRSNAQEQAQ
ncbi:MAG TPA: hypothetical protein VGR22_05765 [Thermomicrobiales bacterium]|nr:hypothetical protein [Thermomicrobiales bacterium]